MLYYLSNFADSRMKVPRYDIDQVLLHEIIFFLSVFSSSEVLRKITSIWSKLLTAACQSREEKIGNQPPLCRKRLWYHRYHRQIILSILCLLRC